MTIFRLTFFLFAFVLPFMLASPAHAATSARLCGALADVIANDLNVFTSPASVGSGVSAKDYADSRKWFTTDTRTFIAKCATTDPNAAYVAAILEAWKAWLWHYSGKDADDAAELAAQMLTKCASTYFATPKGAKCSNWQMRVIRWKRQWRDAAIP